MRGGNLPKRVTYFRWVKWVKTKMSRRIKKAVFGPLLHGCTITTANCYLAPHTYYALPSLFGLLLPTNQHLPPTTTSYPSYFLPACLPTYLRSYLYNPIYLPSTLYYCLLLTTCHWVPAQLWSPKKTRWAQVANAPRRSRQDVWSRPLQKAEHNSTWVAKPIFNLDLQLAASSEFSTI